MKIQISGFEIFLTVVVLVFGFLSWQEDERLQKIRMICLEKDKSFDPVSQVCK